MKLKPFITLFLSCFLCWYSAMAEARAQSQSVKDDVLKIRQMYEKTKVMSFHTVYSFYATETSKEPVETSTGTVKMDGDKSYCKLGELEVISTPSYVFSIDHELMEMAIMNRILSKYPSPKPNVDTLLSACSSIRYFTPGKGLGGYEAVCPSHLYSKIIVVFDRQTYLLKSISFVYAEAQSYGVDNKTKSKVKLEIKYLDYKIGEVFPKETFSYEPYLTKVGKDYSVKKPYLSYHFLNDARARQ